MSEPIDKKTKQKYYQAVRKKRSKPLTYFTQDTQDAILEYVAETDEIKRNIIYNKRIYPVFDKLAEITIHANKFYHYDTNFEDMKSDGVTFMTRQMHKYDPEMGPAFGYFGVIVKRFFIAECKKNFNQQKKSLALDTTDFDNERVVQYYRNSESEDRKEFIDLFVDFYDDNLEALFPRRRDMIIADSVIEIFRKRADLESFNKKTIYIMIRDRTGIKTQYITGVVNQIEEQFRRMYNAYTKYGTLDNETLAREIELSTTNGE